MLRKGHGGLYKDGKMTSIKYKRIVDTVRISAELVLTFNWLPGFDFGFEFS